MLISGTAQKILKSLHLLAVCCWVGGCAGLTLLLHASTDAQSGGELFGILKSYRFVNVIITVYLGAYGSLFTGLAYSLCTNRGFFRHKWIILKWVVTLGMIVRGNLYMGPWSTRLLEMADAIGLSALQDPEFHTIYQLHMRGLLLFLGLFAATTVLSVFRPWEAKEILAMQEQSYQI